MRTAETIDAIRSGKLDEKLAYLYGTGDEELARQRDRYAGAVGRFVEEFGDADVRLFSAPGRTEVGGNHTDHQRGMVLAASVNLDSLAVVEAVDERVIDLVSEGYDPVRVSLDDLAVDEATFGTTEALVRGVCAGMRERGYAIGGFKAYVCSEVLGGAGMSSSASFEALVGEVLSGLYNDGAMDEVVNAQIGQYAENVYFGKPCGLMDQTACAVGGFVHIDFADTEHPVVEPISVDMAEEGYALCIVDTKGSHADLTDDYAAIPQEMREVARCFGCEVLREVSKEAFLERLPELRGTVSDRALLRAFHFLGENVRAGQEATALREGRFGDFLELVRASGDSSYKYLQNIYSNHDVDHQAVSLALAISEDVLGDAGVCRVHGGGFAGTIQAFVRLDRVAAYREALDHLFGAGSCHVLSIRPTGATEVR